jgi:hypothetical protein
MKGGNRPGHRPILADKYRLQHKSGLLAGPGLGLRFGALDAGSHPIRVFSW